MLTNLYVCVSIRVLVFRKIAKKTVLYYIDCFCWNAAAWGSSHAETHNEAVENPFLILRKNVLIISPSKTLCSIYCEQSGVGKNKNE